MSRSRRLRLNLNTQALIKTAGLLSNTVVLATNAFLIGSGISNSLRDRRRARTLQTLELSAQVANAAAGLTKVIVETLENGQRNSSL